MPNFVDQKGEGGKVRSVFFVSFFLLVSFKGLRNVEEELSELLIFFLNGTLCNYKILKVFGSITHWGSNHYPYDSHHHIVTTIPRNDYNFCRGT